MSSLNLRKHDLTYYISRNLLASLTVILLMEDVLKWLQILVSSGGGKDWSQDYFLQNDENDPAVTRC